MATERLTILAVGDLVPTRHLFRGGEPVSSRCAETVNLIRRADIGFGDLEAPLITRGFPREKHAIHGVEVYSGGV